MLSFLAVMPAYLLQTSATSDKRESINTDPNAPIFSCAHYAIVGDLNQVIPQMIKAFKAKQ